MNYVTQVTELSIEKVELGDIDTLKRKARWLKENVKTSAKLAEESKNILKRKERMINHMQDELSKYEMDIKKVKKALSDIGIQGLPKEVVMAEQLLKQGLLSLRDLKS